VRLGASGSAETALAWNEFAAADAADWDNFEDEGAARGPGSWLSLMPSACAPRCAPSCVREPVSSG